MGSGRFMTFHIEGRSNMYSKPLESNDCGRPAPSTEGFHIIKFKHRMGATPSFGVTMISEVPSNPQLTL